MRIELAASGKLQTAINRFNKEVGELAEAKAELQKARENLASEMLNNTTLLPQFPSRRDGYLIQELTNLAIERELWLKRTELLTNWCAWGQKAQEAATKEYDEAKEKAEIQLTAAGFGVEAQPSYQHNQPAANRMFQSHVGQVAEVKEAYRKMKAFRTMVDNAKGEKRQTEATAEAIAQQLQKLIQNQLGA